MSEDISILYCKGDPCPHGSNCPKDCECRFACLHMEAWMKAQHPDYRMVPVK